jgi:hypothetical protein
MVNGCEPTISDVIGFMDGVSFTSECTSERVPKMLSTVGMTVILQSTMCSLMVQIEKFFSVYLNILGVGQTIC